MRGSPITWLSRPALLRAFWWQVRLAARLVREPAVPVALKTLLILPALYVISPIDVLPDLVPILGQLDDLGVILLALQAFVTAAPADAVAFHRAAVQAGRRYSRMSPSDIVIDAEFRRD